VVGERVSDGDCDEGRSVMEMEMVSRVARWWRWRWWRGNLSDWAELGGSSMVGTIFF